MWVCAYYCRCLVKDTGVRFHETVLEEGCERPPILWMLGVELRSSVRAVHALNQGAISPALNWPFLCYCYFCISPDLMVFFLWLSCIRSLQPVG